MSAPTIALPDDAAALKALVLQLQASLRAHDLLIQSLRLQIARLKKQTFGPRSEKVAREIEQLELALEGLQIARAEAEDAPLEETEAAAADAGPAAEAPAEQKTPRRRPRVSEATPRERREMDPGETCPDCGGALRLVGEDVSAMIEMIAAQLKVIEIARLKKSCRCCEKMVQCPAPSRPIPGSLAGPSLLAFILVSKFDDHVPLYRLNEIFARMGADIPDTTMADWCGRAMRALTPLGDLLTAQIMASDLLHADDTPIRVLDKSRRGEPGKGVKQGRIWTYVRDQRPWSGPAPPGAAYFFSPDRKGEHPRRHLAKAKGILQADAYAGFKDLYTPGADGVPQFREAACWAHLRRDFHDVWTETKSEIAKEALDRIGALYDIERAITGRPPEVRQAVRQANSAPKVHAFKRWAEEQLDHISGKSDLAKAFRYALNRWPSFCLFLEDGRVAIDNNPAERGMRPVGVGRRNWLFAGSDAGGETLARALTLIETAKMNGLDPQAYLADLLARIHDHKINRLHELLPWNWRPLSAEDNKVAA